VRFKCLWRARFHDAPIIWQKHGDYCAPVHTMDASWNSEKSWSNGRKDTGSLGNGSSSQSGSAPSGKFKAAIVKIGNLSMKEVVCLSHGDLSNHSASCHTLGTVGKPSISRGAPS